MGLKYALFMVKMDADELMSSLLNMGFKDETQLMLDNQAWEKQHFDWLLNHHKQARDKVPAPEDWDKQYAEWWKAQPEGADLLEYHLKSKSQTLYDFQLWLRELPGAEGWLVGQFTHYGISGFSQYNDFLAVVMGYMVRANVGAFAIQKYHHNSDTGSVIIVNADGKELDSKEPKAWGIDVHEPENEHQFMKFARGLRKQTGFPADYLHDWIDSTSDNAGWTHQASFPLIPYEGEENANTE